MIVALKPIPLTTTFFLLYYELGSGTSETEKEGTFYEYNKNYCLVIPSDFYAT